MKCLFCNQDVIENQDAITKVYDCKCPNCGSYKLSEMGFETSSIRENIEFKEKKHLISGCIFEMNERGESIDLITPNNVKDFLKSHRIPKSVNDQFEKVLNYLNKKTTYLYESIMIDLNRYAIAYAKHSTEFENILEALKDLDYLSLDSGSNYLKVKLTLRGLAKISKMNQVITDSKQCFVAMWFSEDMKATYDSSISKAVEGCGYKPVIISLKQFNNDITDEIIAEIRKSKFMIADFTGNRGGVYFEAGFASGLGIPVIWTCKKDNFEKDKVHFDVNHFNFVVWDDGDDLYTKLKNRIEATIIPEKYHPLFQT